MHVTYEQCNVCMTSYHMALNRKTPLSVVFSKFVNTQRTVHTNTSGCLRGGKMREEVVVAYPALSLW